MSSLARVIRNKNGSLYEVKRLQFIFAWDLAAACIIGVSFIAGFPQDESCLFSALWYVSSKVDITLYLR